MTAWGFLLELVLALSTALILGSIFERLKLGAVVGYIVAGVVVGAVSREISGTSLSPSGPDWTTETINLLAELGISMLLFATGLEFSVLKLRKLGRSIFLGEITQVILGVIGLTGVAVAFGMPWKPALAVGLIGVVSSTAIVVRTLRDRGELDALHGKKAFGVLLIQDIALLPLVLIMTAIAGPEVGKAAKNTPIAVTVFIVILFAVLLTRFVPKLFRSRAMQSNRDLPILLAVITCLGAAWSAHEIGLSPSLGAFLAGMLLAESTFEHQIRADIAGLRALLVTLFFLSVGVMVDLDWVGRNLGLVAVALLVTIVTKIIFNFIALRLWKRATISSLAAAINLANVGELGFVLLQLVVATKLFNEEQSQLVTVVTVLSMVVATALIRNSNRIARALALRFTKTETLAIESKEERSENFSGHLVIVGFGTAGRNAIRVLCLARYQVVAVDIDPKFAGPAKELGAVPLIGDATAIDMLQELHLNDALALIIAIPDPRTATRIIALAKEIAPELTIVARSRVHQYQEDLIEAGATLAIGEEELLGRSLGEEAIRLVLGRDDPEVHKA